MTEETGNGFKLLSRLRISWTAALIIIGWAALGLIFYSRTNYELEELQKQINEINRQHERFAETTNSRFENVYKELHDFINRVDRLDTPLSKKVESNTQLLSFLNERTIVNAQRIEQLNNDIKRLQERTDKIVTALDSLYNQVQELSREVAKKR